MKVKHNIFILSLFLWTQSAQAVIEIYDHDRGNYRKVPASEYEDVAKELGDFKSWGRKPITLGEMQGGVYKGTSLQHASETYEKMVNNFSALTKALVNSKTVYGEDSAVDTLLTTAESRLRTLKESMQSTIDAYKDNPKSTNQGTNDALNKLTHEMNTALTVMNAFENLTRKDLGTETPGLESLPRSGDFTLEAPKKSPPKKPTILGMLHKAHKVVRKVIGGTITIKPGSNEFNDMNNGGAEQNHHGYQQLNNPIDERPSMQPEHTFIDNER